MFQVLTAFNVVNLLFLHLPVPGGRSCLLPRRPPPHHGLGSFDSSFEAPATATATAQVLTTGPTVTVPEPVPEAEAGVVSPVVGVELPDWAVQMLPTEERSYLRDACRARGRACPSARR
jgi:hypothetical protein